MKLSCGSVVPRVLVILWAGYSTAIGGGLRFEDLSTPPADSAEAERVRIWLPVYRQSSCRVTVDILNDSNQVIRHLVDRLMSAGYYNFYWDKKDDSERYVPAGTYAYVVNNCGTKRYGELAAEFRTWEVASRMYPPEEKWSTKIGFELLEDSALVSIHIFNRRGNPVARPVVDSLMNKGRYEFEWVPVKGVPRGIYTLKLVIGDFARTAKIGYRP